MFKNRNIDWAAHADANEDGFYRCTQCNALLFTADKKFDSKTGFPSFWSHFQDHVLEKHLTTYGRDRLQVVCKNCGQHLGHLFEDARTPSQVRYCINAASISASRNDK